VKKMMENRIGKKDENGMEAKEMIENE